MGAIAAVSVEMTSMSEMVALFNGTGGAPSTLVALAVIWDTLIEAGVSGTAADALGGSAAFTVALSILIGVRA